MTFIPHWKSLILSTAVLLAACGGSSGNSQNQLAPTIEPENFSTSSSSSSSSTSASSSSSGASGASPSSSSTSSCSSSSSSSSSNSSSSSGTPTTLTLSGSTITEGNAASSALIFSVNLSQPAMDYVYVDYQTEDGTATAGDEDYLPQDGKLAIPPGQVTAEISIQVLTDLNPEGNETFSLRISQVSDNAVIAQASISGEILNDDFPSTAPEFAPLPRGIFSTSARGSGIPQSIVDNPNLKGYMIIDAWAEIETTESVFSWHHIDSEVQRAKAVGKRVRLAVHTGGESVPNWLIQRYPAIKRILVYDKQTGEPRWIPAYWDPIFIEAKQRLYQAIGERYKDEPTLFAVSASMVDPNTGDWSFDADTEEQINSYLSAGFSEATFVTAYQKLLNYAMSAFKNKYVTTAVGPIPLDKIIDGAPIADRLVPIETVLDQAYDSFGERLIIAKGSLNATTPLAEDVPARHPWNTMLRYAPNALGQFIDSVTSDPEYRMNGHQVYSEAQSEQIFMEAMQVGFSYDLRWIEIWARDAMNEQLQDKIIAASNILSSE